ncbi:hypothetical protein BOX15_Mlig013159g1 [Macrostomum lignano]|uniref:TNFR-Cys domain-containing protein n=1 Tax=Macrostomum lignano TaxID=282301 RepID=A0A267GL60_9PLAT|nr:hypothetical protein BOX15_Mlig013159g1 [Macrostomum lignano]
MRIISYAYECIVAAQLVAFCQARVPTVPTYWNNNAKQNSHCPRVCFDCSQAHRLMEKFWGWKCQQLWNRGVCRLPNCSTLAGSRDAETASSSHNSNSSAKQPGNASHVNTGVACNCNCPSDSWPRSNTSSLIGKSVTEAPNLAENASRSGSDISGVAVNNKSSCKESLQPNTTTEGSNNDAADKVDPWPIVWVLAVLLLVCVIVLSCVIYKQCKNARTAVKSSADRQCKFNKGESCVSQLLTKDEQTAAHTDADDSAVFIDGEESQSS